MQAHNIIDILFDTRKQRLLHDMYRMIYIGSVLSRGTHLGTLGEVRRDLELFIFPGGTI